MVAADSILNAMVTQLAATMVPDSGDPVSSERPIYDARRYMGGDLVTPELFKRGGAGRMPAARVRHSGTRRLRTTNRYDRVESTFSVVVASDSHRSKDDRQKLLALSEAVRAKLGRRSFGLAISRLQFASMDTLRDDEQMMALDTRFTCRHRTDYTVDPGDDTLDSVSGQIVNAETTRSPKPNAPTLTMQGTAGTTHYAWALVGVAADGQRTLLGFPVATDVGPEPLSSTDKAHLTWIATPGIATYEVHRIESSGAAAIGRIGNTTALTFNDVGQSVIEPTPLDPFHLDLEEVFT